jgi:hypothetical protein
MTQDTSISHTNPGVWVLYYGVNGAKDFKVGRRIWRCIKAGSSVKRGVAHQNRVYRMMPYHTTHSAITKFIYGDNTILHDIDASS